MKVLTVEDLKDFGLSGVSEEQLQKSLSLNSGSKKFIRKRDVPKRLGKKALYFFQQGLPKNQEKSFFITETNYSYTLWEEEQIANTTTQSKDISSVSNASANQPQQVRKYRGVVISNQEDHNINNSSSNPPITKPKKSVRKYRGAIIEE